MNTKEFISLTREIFKTNEQIPLHSPIFTGNEKKYLGEAIDAIEVSSRGRIINQVENEINRRSGAKAVALLSSGTSALHMGLIINGVKPGDEILTQALTFVATANTINYLQAEPVFIDVDKDTMGMSPLALKDYLDNHAELRNGVCHNRKTGRKISACIPMHTFGFMCRIEELVGICKQWNIPVVEDSAESFGSYYKNSFSGTIGQMGIYSFNGNKIITSGGGGAIVSSDIDLINKAKHISSTAKSPHAWEYYHDEIGYNYIMPNLNAALLMSQLESFERIIEIKKELFSRYNAEKESLGLPIKAIPQDTNWNYWLFSIECENKEERDSFLSQTNENGVMTRPIWQLMYRLPMFQHCERDDQVNAEYLESRIVNIPSSISA